MISTSERKIRECRLRNGTIVKITNFEDLDLFFIDITEKIDKEPYTQFEEELYAKLKNVIEDESELLSIQIIIDHHEKYNSEYDLLSIKNLIDKFK